MEVVEGAGAFLAWLGASLIVLGDGRRGLALGLGVAAVGIAVASIPVAGWLAAGTLAAGGIVAAAGRLRTGRPGWAIMPAGSTPRLVLCVAGGLLVLWVGVAVITGDDAGLRFAVLASIGLAGARMLASDETPTALTAAAVVAMGLAGAAALGDESYSLATYVLAAAIAVATSWIPIRAPRAA